MAEQAEVEDEAAAEEIAEEVGPPGSVRQFGPMVRDVIRVSTIVGGFAVVLLSFHHGMAFYDDPDRGVGDIVDSILAVFD
jgi:hypothetical protein